MGDRARALGIVPDLLRPRAPTWTRCATRATTRSRRRSTLIARLCGAQAAQARRRATRGPTRTADKAVIVYSGMLHNDLSPAAGARGVELRAGARRAGRRAAGVDRPRRARVHRRRRDVARAAVGRALRPRAARARRRRSSARPTAATSSSSRRRPRCGRGRPSEEPLGRGAGPTASRTTTRGAGIAAHVGARARRRAAPRCARTADARLDPHARPGGRPCPRRPRGVRDRRAARPRDAHARKELPRLAARASTGDFTRRPTSSLTRATRRDVARGARLVRERALRGGAVRRRHERRRRRRAARGRRVARRGRRSTCARWTACSRWTRTSRAARIQAGATGPAARGAARGARAHAAALSAELRALHARRLDRDARGRALRDALHAHRRPRRVGAHGHAARRLRDAPAACVGRGPRARSARARLRGHPRRHHRGVGARAPAAALPRVGERALRRLRARGGARRGPSRRAACTRRTAVCSIRARRMLNGVPADGGAVLLLAFESADHALRAVDRARRGDLRRSRAAARAAGSRRGSTSAAATRAPRRGGRRSSTRRTCRARS